MSINLPEPSILIRFNGLAVVIIYSNRGWWNSQISAPWLPLIMTAPLVRRKSIFILFFFIFWKVQIFTLKIDSFYVYDSKCIVQTAHLWLVHGPSMYWPTGCEVTTVWKIWLHNSDIGTRQVLHLSSDLCHMNIWMNNICTLILSWQWQIFFFQRNLYF